MKPLSLLKVLGWLRALRRACRAKAPECIVTFMDIRGPVSGRGIVFKERPTRFAGPSVFTLRSASAARRGSSASPAQAPDQHVGGVFQDLQHRVLGVLPGVRESST